MFDITKSIKSNHLSSSPVDSDFINLQIKIKKDFAKRLAVTVSVLSLPVAQVKSDEGPSFLGKRAKTSIS